MGLQETVLRAEINPKKPLADSDKSYVVLKGRKVAQVQTTHKMDKRYLLTGKRRKRWPSFIVIK